eukprot:TRINITY_DN65081_c0_g1_i1.p1 TRINITY_DN65081_c0_g1~~TRINITY_DN65081_c0_g1_i1.p1  ORF type:complete len:370 (+),score=102.81 TRINITY_DN65081_c0_g1_i1:65-1174(+)
MRRPAVLLASCVALLPSGAQALGPPSAEDGIVELDPLSFEQTTANGQHWVVTFYAPWCAHCKRFRPTWAALGRAVAASDTEDIGVGQLDGTVDGVEEITEAFQVTGYPTVVVQTIGGKRFKFTGNRDIASLLAFVRRHTGILVERDPKPPVGGSGSVLRLTAKSVARVLAAEAADVLVRFTAPWCQQCAAGNSGWTALAAAAGPDTIVAELDTDKYPDVADRLGVGALPAVRLYRRHLEWKLGTPGEGSCSSVCESFGLKCEGVNHTVWKAAVAAASAMHLFRLAGAQCEQAVRSGSCTAPFLVGAVCNYVLSEDMPACGQVCRGWNDDKKIASMPSGAARLCPCRGDVSVREFSGKRTPEAYRAFLGT